ncbi:universal stress protein [Candidatus Woesearchaeota archaeon]|nr:universal stress protein [Candidatus Woesearchaeota archaeon]
MIKRVLLPVDGSSFSEKAGEYAIYLAKNLNAHIIVIHVIQVGATQKLDSENIEMKKLRQSDLCFKSLKEKAVKEAIELETKILVSRTIVDSILEEAKDGDYDLIVMGSRGLSGIKKLVLGSVTGGVVKKSTIPVLVV